MTTNATSLPVHECDIGNDLTPVTQRASFSSYLDLPHEDDPEYDIKMEAYNQAIEAMNDRDSKSGAAAEFDFNGTVIIDKNGKIHFLPKTKQPEDAAPIYNNDVWDPEFEGDPNHKGY